MIMSRSSLSSCACVCDPSGVTRRKRRHHNWESGFILAIFLLLIEATLAQPRVSVDASAPPATGKVAVPETAEILSRDLASKDLAKDKDGGVDPSSSKTLFFGEDLNGVPIVVGTWFRYGSYTLAFSMFGTSFLMSCIAAAIYYVIFVVTEPSQQIRSLKDDGHGQGPLGGASSWNVGKVLRALQIAYDTYESFDPYSSACQLKTLCEIQESPYFQGSVLKRVTHFLVHTDLVENKLESAKQLRAADRIGNDPKVECQEKFVGCRFSLNKLYENYVTVMM